MIEVPELFCAKIPRQNRVCRGYFYSQSIFIFTEYVNKKLSQKEIGLTFWKPLLIAAEKSAIIFFIPIRLRIHRLPYVLKRPIW